MSSLREDLHGANEKHKQQLAEMALLQEEEKQRAFLDREASLDRLRSDMERIRSDLEESHQQEKDAAQEKVGEGFMKHITSLSSVDKCISNKGFIKCETFFRSQAVSHKTEWMTLVFEIASNQ